MYSYSIYIGVFTVCFNLPNLHFRHMSVATCQVTNVLIININLLSCLSRLHRKHLYIILHLCFYDYVYK